MRRPPEIKTTREQRELQKEEKRIADERRKATDIDYETWQSVLSFLDLEGYSMYAERIDDSQVRLMLEWTTKSGKRKKVRAHPENLPSDSKVWGEEMKVIAYRIMKKNYGTEIYDRGTGV